MCAAGTRGYRKRPKTRDGDRWEELARMGSKGKKSGSAAIFSGTALGIDFWNGMGRR